MMNEKTMTVEAILHRKIASILGKGDQGRVMGAYREAVKEAASQPYRGGEADKWWFDELAKIPPREIRKLTQQNFDAMDETMGFEYKPIDVDRYVYDANSQLCGVKPGDLEVKRPSPYIAPDARDHSLTEQGSWIKRWLEAK